MAQATAVKKAVDLLEAWEDRSEEILALSRKAVIPVARSTFVIMVFTIASSVVVPAPNLLLSLFLWIAGMPGLVPRRGSR